MWSHVQLKVEGFIIRKKRKMVQLWNLSLQDVADPLRKAGSKLLHEHFVF